MTEQKDDIIDFTVILKLITYPLSLLKKYYKLSFVYVSCGILLAVILKFTLPSVYSGSFIIKTNEDKDLFFFSMLLDIQNLVKDKDYQTISNELSIPENEALLLKKIELLPIFKSASKDSSNSVVITFNMSEHNRFIEVQNALIKYLENSSHYQKLSSRRLANIDSLERKINREINEMDSVKNIIISSIKAPVATGNGMVYNVPIDPYKAYDINMGRFKEQLWLLNQKKLTNSFELIKPCVVSKKPIWPKLYILVFVFIPISIIFFMIHAYRKEKIVNN